MKPYIRYETGIIQVPRKLTFWQQVWSLYSWDKDYPYEYAHEIDQFRVYLDRNAPAAFRVYRSAYSHEWNIMVDGEFIGKHFTTMDGALNYVLLLIKTKPFQERFNLAA